MLYACDRDWWKVWGNIAAKKFSGEMWTTNEPLSRSLGLNFVPSEPGEGLAKRAGFIRQGRNSGYQAVGLALLFGAARVVLLGYDMAMHGNRSHWHGDHKGLNNPRAHQLNNWCEIFATLAEAMKARKHPAEIVNCSRATALTCFHREALENGLVRVARTRKKSPGS